MIELGPAEQQRVLVVARHRASGADGVGGLIGMLDDPAWAVRRHVVAALGASGELAVAALCDVLRHRRDDEARIAAAVDALVASQSDVLESMRGLSTDATPAVVADAAQVLGRRSESRAVPVLVGLLPHPDDNVAVAAIEALGRIGGRAAVESLLETAKGASFFRTFSAIDVLGRSGDPRVIAPLTSLLNDPTFTLEAAKALGRTGEHSAVPALVALLLRSAETHVRAGALALADLLRRQQERYGTRTAVERELTACVEPAAVTRRILHSLSGSDPAELEAFCVLLGLLGTDESIPTLVTLLDSPGAAGAAAADALRVRGRGSDEALLAPLAAGPGSRRLLLLPILSSGKSAEGVVACLDDPDPLVRALACETLGRLGNPSVVRRLFGFIGDPSARVAHAAVAAIQSLGSEETEKLALEASRGESAAVRRSALRILGYFGFRSALPALIEASQRADPAERELGIVGLASVDESAGLDVLLEIAKKGDARSRAASMRGLGSSASSDPRVTSYLLRGLADEDPWVRYYAVQALGKQRFARGAESIAAKLDDHAGQVRVAAVEALAYLDGDAAHNAMVNASRSPDADVARAAIMGLGIQGRTESLPLLLEAVASPDASTRLVAVSAISHFRDAAALEALVHAAEDPDEGVANSATSYLAARPGAEVTRRLAALLRVGSNPDRVLAALRLPVSGRIGGLRALLESSDDDLCSILVSVLVRMQRPDATEAVFDGFTSSNPAARRAAASGLGAMGTPEARVALQTAAKKDPDEEVRRISALLSG